MILSISSNSLSIFVSHSGDETQEIKELLEPLNYLPTELYIVVRQHHTGKIQDIIEANLSNSDILLPYLTEAAVDNRWVNQEIGYAKGNDLTIIPVFKESDYLSGFVSDMAGVKISDDPEETMYHIIAYLRDEYSPRGFGPNWCLNFKCDICDEDNIFSIVPKQDELLRMYQDGSIFDRKCTRCGVTHQFNPASMRYVGKSGEPDIDKIGGTSV